MKYNNIKNTLKIHMFCQFIDNEINNSGQKVVKLPYAHHHLEYWPYIKAEFF